MMPPGAFYFLFTYLITPFLIGASFRERHYLVASALAIWWLPMIYSAIQDWRRHHFGYESQFSKIWFWGGVWILSVVYLVFSKKHTNWPLLAMMVILPIISICYFISRKCKGSIISNHNPFK